MTLQEHVAAQALSLVGVRYRLHGRSVVVGLDCVGLVVLAATRAGLRTGPLPAYMLRGTGREKAELALARSGLEPVADLAAGDVLLAESGPMQLHLMLQTGEGIVHAHAGLGRVVLMPAPSPWPLLGQWRFRPSRDQE